MYYANLFMLFRFVDENGNNYNVTMDILGPYGPARIFTGPKVRVGQLIYFIEKNLVEHEYMYVLICTCIHMYIISNSYVIVHVHDLVFQKCKINLIIITYVVISCAIQTVA